MQHLRVFGLMPTGSPQIPRMPTFTAYHDPKKPGTIREATINNYDLMPYWVSQMDGPKAVQFRWILAQENDPGVGGDPMRTFERGGYDVTKYIRMIRPAARRLRRMNIPLDAIFLDNEGGFSIFQMSPAQLRAVYANPKIKRKMPPAVRNTPVEKLILTDPAYDPAACLPYMRWVQSLQVKAMRQIFIESKLFHAVRGPGQSPTPPMVFNFNWIAPGRRVYEEHGWPLDPGPLIDGRSSNIGLYFGRGGLRYQNRNHDVLWNKLTDYLNYARACLSSPGGAFWPTILQPIRNNVWLFEQMIGHLARTGVNWTATQSGYVYFNEWSHLTSTADPKAVEIFNRHDQPFPAQRGLPDIPLDSDRLETAGFVTRYEDFLANVPANSQAFGETRDILPMSVQARPLQAAA